MKKSNIQIGKFGETLAARYLLTKGYYIIGRNIKTSYQEIDILAYSKGIYVIVEVKTKCSDLGSPEEAFSRKKIRALKIARQSIQEEYALSGEKMRIDLVAIKINRWKKIAKIKHYLAVV